MLRNKKGQALVEFIIILPVFLLMIFAALDFGKVIYVKNELANVMPEVKSLYEENATYDEMLALVRKNNIDNKLIIANENNKYIKIEIYREIELITPGLGLVVDNPYKALTSLVIEYEK